VLAAAAVGSYLWEAYSSAAKRPPEGVARFAITIDTQDWIGLDRPTIVLSPDGSRFVYLERNDADTRLYVRAIDQFEGHPLPGTENAVNPFVAPDGEWIGFFADQKLKKVSLRGGAPIELCALASTPLGASWSSAGSIVLGSASGLGLSQVPASGGTPKPLGTSQNSDGATTEAWPEALPDGKSVLFTVMPAGQKPAFVAVASLVTGERKSLIEGSSGHYVSTGHLVYMRGSSLMGVRFDPARLEVVGTPVALLDNVQKAEGAGAAQFSVSNTGSLVYIARAGGSRLRHLMLVDRRGQAEQIAPPARSYADPRVSPDGQRIVVDIFQENTGTDVWVYDMPRTTWNQLTFNGKSNVPIWTPDGKRVTLAATTDGRSKLYWKAADGSGPDELLSTEPGHPHSWSPNGRWLAQTTGGPTNIGIGLLPMDGDRKMRPFVSKKEGNEMAAPAFSPDGRWIAYVSNESGRRQVYVRGFPAGEGRWLVSSEGGTQPMWARDGRELFYRDGDKMMAVAAATTPVFRADKPKLLFEGRYESPAIRSNYDVTADGQHFVMVKADEQQSTNRQLNIVVNWADELRRRVPGSDH
jgi:Tol biopolymer transport system component